MEVSFCYTATMSAVKCDNNFCAISSASGIAYRKHTLHIAEWLHSHATSEMVPPICVVHRLYLISRNHVSLAVYQLSQLAKCMQSVMT